MSLRHWARLGIAVLIAAPLGGCATLTPKTSKKEVAAKRAPTPKRESPPPSRARRDEAIREFEIKRNQAQYEAAISRWHEGDVAGCRQNLTQLLARDPRHVEATLLWAELALDQQETDDALERLQPCATQNPQDARVQHTLGLVWEAKGRQTEALACFQRAVKLAPSEEVFRISYETAAAGLSGAAATESPSDLPPNNLRSPAVSTQAAAREQRKPTKTRARQSAPGDKNVELVIERLTIDTTATSSQLATRELLRKAIAALDASDATQAALWFERAMACEPTNVQIPVQAALRALEHEQPDLAIALVAGQADQFPRNAPLQLVLGVAYYRQADFNSAQSALQQALSLDKRSSLSYFLMGSTLQQLGNSKGAAASFSRAAELDSKLVRR